jgi:hypothetical protein
MNSILGQDVSNSGEYQLSVFDFFREIILQNFYSNNKEQIEYHSAFQMIKSDYIDEDMRKVYSQQSV